ncbi:MAG: diaminopimelate epimerase [Phycisphaerales bacterium]|nr:MAG: diaminopimelate epimerase [Phycisphaerales bacterium]
MKFTKMHGLGNDYVYLDCFAEPPGVADLPALARQISDRHRGVGGDGLILMRPSQGADLRMEMYNADGGRAQMCGNGIRCVARYAWERGLTKANPMVIETDAGLRVAEVKPPDSGACSVTVVMGTPKFHPAALPARFAGERIDKAEFEVRGRLLRVSCVSLGNPHAVVFVKDFAEIDVERDGPALENHPIFPDRINVHFARVDGPGAITMKSWERGSGVTQACGTGACAAGILAETHMPVRVHLPGGRLLVDWVQPAGASEPPHTELLKLAGRVGALEKDVVLMTGPAEFVFEGEWNPS